MRNPLAIASLVVGLVVAGAPLAGATTTTSYCQHATTSLVISSVALPKSTQLSALLNSVEALAPVQKGLKGDLVKIKATAQHAPKSIAPYYGDALAAVESEIAETNNLAAEVTNLLANSSNESTMLVIAADVVAATSDATRANTYLAVAAPLAKTYCTPVKKRS